LEAIRQDFASKGVRFYYVYKALAHPELHGYVQPYTLEERLAHVREAVRRLGTRIPWLVDPMDNRLKHAFGDQPNSEFIIGPDGKVVLKRAWCDPQALREDLERLVGAPESHTDPAELNLGAIRDTATRRRPEELPQLELPGDLTPVVVKPHLVGEEPFYAKLRVEVERAVLNDGEGQVFLALRLDPLYHVHWNNLVGPVRLKLLLPDDGPVFEATELTALRPQQESDGAPREFLIRVRKVNEGDRIEAVVYYAACSDEEGWCKILTQRYTIVFRRDKDAGRVIGRGRRRPERNVAVREAARGSGRRSVLTGAIVEARGNVLRIRDSAGATRSVRLLPGTRIFRSGRAAPRDRLKQGTRIGVFGQERNGEFWAMRLLILHE